MSVIPELGQCLFSILLVVLKNEFVPQMLDDRRTRNDLSNWRISCSTEPLQGKHFIFIRYLVSNQHLPKIFTFFSISLNTLVICLKKNTRVFYSRPNCSCSSSQLKPLETQPKRSQQRKVVANLVIYLLVCLNSLFLSESSAARKTCAILAGAVIIHMMQLEAAETFSDFASSFFYFSRSLSKVTYHMPIW